jgi:hypothetical protein
VSLGNWPPPSCVAVARGAVPPMEPELDTRDPRRCPTCGCSNLAHWEALLGAVPPREHPHSEAIGDDDIVALVERLGFEGVGVDEIATVRAWLKEHDDEVAL